MFASEKWNASKKGIISIMYDSSLCDVIITDVKMSDPHLLGVTDPKGYIRFNTTTMRQSSKLSKKHIAMHEIGNALGLAHNSGSNDVMKSPANNAVNLTSNDKASLEVSYSRYRK